MNGWLNIYKPRGISSAQAVAKIKKIFQNDKVGHTGTLDPEAEGILPIAIGEATKLAGLLLNSRKEYIFQVKFGSRTDTGDIAGKVIQTCSYIPSHQECLEISNSFIGVMKQTPPIYSAIRVNGRKAYELARSGQEVMMKARDIHIYNLECTDYDSQDGVATFVCECSKGTYIRTLAEDISSTLQSAGFVIRLIRSRLGHFTINNSVKMVDCHKITPEEIAFLHEKCLRIDYVLDDIPVLVASYDQAKKIVYGQECQFDINDDYQLVWIKTNGSLLAFGSLNAKIFKSSRVFNLVNIMDIGKEQDVDN